MFQISAYKHLWWLILVGYQVPTKLLYHFPFSTGQRDKKWQGQADITQLQLQTKQTWLRENKLLSVNKSRIMRNVKPLCLQIHSQTTATSHRAKHFLPKEDGIVRPIWGPFCPQTKLPCCVGPYANKGVCHHSNNKGDAQHQAHDLILYSLWGWT